MVGVVRNLNLDRGFLFIRVTPDGGKPVDYFAHRSALRDGLRIDDLREGDAVQFEPEDSPKGPRAEEVRRATTTSLD